MVKRGDDRYVDHGLVERGERAKKLIAFLERIKAKEVFKDDKSKMAFIESLTFEDFKRWIERVNAELRGIDKTQARMDGSSVRVEEGMAIGNQMAVGYNPPAEEDREALLQEVFESAKGMKDAKDIALLMGGGITAIHPFADGNGRTSRLVYTLLHDSYAGNESDNERLAKILDAKGRRVVDVNLRKINIYMIHDLEDQDLGFSDFKRGERPTQMWSDTSGGRVGGFGPEDIQAREKIPEKIRQKLVDTFEEKGAAVYVFSKYLQDQGKDLSGYLRPYDDGRVSLLVDKIFSEMTAEDAQKLIDIRHGLKRDYIRFFIDIMANPEEYVIYHDSDSGLHGNLKDLFALMVEENESDLRSGYKKYKQKILTELEDNDEGEKE